MGANLSCWSSVFSVCENDLCSVTYSFTGGHQCAQENSDLRTANIWAGERAKKKELNRKRNTERARERERSLCCIIWQGDLSSAIRWRRQNDQSHTHTHTHSLSLFLCVPLFLLVSFQSRDQPLADRTGPLGSCYRPAQRRDWKALIAALRSPQSRENHSVSVIGSLAWDRGKRGNELADRKGEWIAG